MNSRFQFRRLAGRGGIAVFAAAAVAAGLQGGAGGALASVAARPTARPAGVVNPFSPAYRHRYRHGVVPTIARQQQMNRWAASHPSPQVSAGNLFYGGGVDGIGVTTGHAKVYLVFYGSQWGTQSHNAKGDLTLSGDKSAMAPYLQELLKGLGTGHELWSAVMTQYCGGVALGGKSCPAGNMLHIPYPADGALAGVWADESAPTPPQATGHQLGQEAVRAAKHFGNTTAAANRDAQYVIVSPYGANPDGWLTSNFCAWHDYNGDSFLSGGPVPSPYGDIAFTNLPYITMAGRPCGANFVNTHGPLDGVSVVEGHEYAETLTDQNPAGGWLDGQGNETGDKCAWITPGTNGGGFDLTTATGTFAMQTTWGNDFNGDQGGCEAYHAIVPNGGGGANTVYVTNPAYIPPTTVGSPVSLQIVAYDTASNQTFTYTAAGLPPGLSINRSTGLISGTSAAAHISTVTVTATDTTGAKGSDTFPLTIQLLRNPGFETGHFTPWAASTPLMLVSFGAHSGTWAARLDGYGQAHTDTLAQTVTIPPTCKNPGLSFWLYVGSTDPTGTAHDTFTVQVLNSSGAALATLATFSNKDVSHVSGMVYSQHSYSLAKYANQKITIRYTGKEIADGYNTSFYNDDNAVTCT